MKAVVRIIGKSAPKFPLPPDDPLINLMRADQGPFKCGHCKYFKGAGKSCPKQTAKLQPGDCCNKYESI